MSTEKITFTFTLPKNRRQQHHRLRRITREFSTIHQKRSRNFCFLGKNVSTRVCWQKKLHSLHQTGLVKLSYLLYDMFFSSSKKEVEGYHYKRACHIEDKAIDAVLTNDASIKFFWSDYRDHCTFRANHCVVFAYVMICLVGSILPYTLLLFPK